MITYPENSLLALIKAAELGFSYFELDIQFSKDLKPIVIHDDNLVRTTAINKFVSECLAEELMSIQVLTSLKNIDPSLLKVSTLDKAVEVLNNYSNITLFVEIKRQVLDHANIDMVVETILRDLNNAKFKFVLISFVKEVIEVLKLKGEILSGWVLKKYNQSYHEIAKEMRPNYLFCNIKKVDQPLGLWKGPWQWVLYDIKNPVFAYELLEQGVDLIETGDIVRLSNSEYFI